MQAVQRSRRGPIWCLAALVHLAASAAHGQGAVTAETPAASAKDDAARQHFEAGIAFFANADYESARVEFEAGLKLNGNAEWLFNLAKVAQKQGRLSEARQYALRYQAAKGADAKDATELLESIGSAPAAEVAPRPPAKLGGWLPWLMVGVGGASLVGAAACSIAGLNLAQQLEANPVTLPEYDSLRATGSSLNAASGSLLAVGLGLTAGGLTWGILWRRSRVTQSAR